LKTANWNGDYNDPWAGEALTNANMGYLATAPIDVAGVYTDQSGWDNYLIVSYLISTSTSKWDYLQPQKVTYTSPHTYSFGNIDIKFANVSVLCTTMYPGNANTPVMKNSIFIDAVGAN